MQDVAIIGFGGYAKHIANCVEQSGNWKVVGYIDKDKSSGAEFSEQNLEEVKSAGIKYLVNGVGNLSHPWMKSMLGKFLDDDFEFPTIVHPSAVVSNSVTLGKGVLILENAVIKTEANVGDFSLINSLALVSHGCVIGELTHLSLGAKIGGDCIVGENCLLGINSSVIKVITIGTNVIIGAGTVILKDVQDQVVIVGNPGKVLKKRNG